MIFENEPCPNFPDLYNGGCAANGSINTIPVHCGDRICGTSEVTSQHWDIDYYELNLTAPDSVRWCVYANFAVQLAIIQKLGPCGPDIQWASYGGTRCDTACAAACLPAGRFWLMVMSASANVNCALDQYVAEVRCLPCQGCSVCPPTTTLIENEPCPNIPDLYNGGCSSTNLATIPVQCGEEICGTVTSYDFADEDFYSITLTQPDSIIWCVTPDFNALAGIYSPVPNCAMLVPYAAGTTPECSTLCLSACLSPGTYWLRVTPVGLLRNTCKAYSAHVTCTPCNGAPIDTCPYPSRDIEPANNQCQTATMDFVCGDTLCGEITNVAGIPPDKDWYNVFLPGPGCQTIAINCYGNDSPGWFPAGGGLNPRLSLWKTDCTTLLNFDDSSGVGDDAFLTSPCLPPGQYKLLVQGVGMSAGPYILTSRCGSCACPCSLSCGSLPTEGEACPNLTSPDAYNGGCSSGLVPEPFGTITCGQVFCATSFAMGGIVDHDWYQLTLTAPRRIQWLVSAEFPYQMTISQPNPNCSNLITLATQSGQPCQPKLAFIKCLAPGTYYFHVMPTVTTGVPCSEYISLLKCGKCIIHHVVIGPVDVTTGTGIKLTWEADETLPVYNVYRMPQFGLEPAPDFRIASTEDTVFIDTTALSLPNPVFFYQVTMEDPVDTSGTP